MLSASDGYLCAVGSPRPCVTVHNKAAHVQCRGRPAATAHSKPLTVTESDVELKLRLQLGAVFPNALVGTPVKIMGLCSCHGHVLSVKISQISDPDTLSLCLAAQLLPDSRLPSLLHSKHFVNLTNGLDLVPLLSELQISFRYA